MKKILLILTLMISFNSYGEWVKAAENSTIATSYIDMDTIKEHKGYVYWWGMSDYLKPMKSGTMSTKTYYQGDCGVNRYKPLSYIFYKQPMGKGSGETDNTPNEWEYPSPGSISGFLLMYACIYAD